jgi:S1-C subfamily serine protease
MLYNEDSKLKEGMTVTLIKKIALFTGLAVMILALSGCSFVENFTFQGEDYALESSMIESRTLLRRANVGVNVEYKQNGTFFDHTRESQGSGVIFLKDDTYYYALTNFHVVDPGDSDEVLVRVIPSMVEEEISAVVMASDDTRDLALLRFEIGDYELGVIEIVENIEINRDELVLAVGNPSAVNSIVTFGQYLGMVDTDDVAFQVIYHSALIYPGNSGGALTDVEGRLIGINTWGVVGEDERSLAVPLEEILAFLSDKGFDEESDEPLETAKGMIE